MTAHGNAASDFKDRLVFDVERGELRDGPVRYLLIRQDTLVGLFQRLSLPAQRAALQAFAQAVEERGGQSIDRYQEFTPPDRLVALVAKTASQLGWGSWRFDRSVPGQLALEVENSPFRELAGDLREPACAPISGMLRALAARILGGPVTIDEVICAGAGGACCRFRARLASAEASEGKHNPQSATVQSSADRGA